MRRVCGLESRSCLWASTLAASLALGGPAAFGGEPVSLTAPELRLAWVDLSGTPSGLRDAATQRVRDLLAPAGVRVSGFDVEAGVGVPMDGVRVVLMRSRPRLPGRPPIVGGAAGPKEEKQPSVWIFLSAIARGLGLDLDRHFLWTVLERRDFSQALAVVVVHELTHTLLGAEHAPEGLLSASLDRRRLLDARLALEPSLHPALRVAVGALERAGIESAEANVETDSRVAMIRP